LLNCHRKNTGKLFHFYEEYKREEVDSFFTLSGFEIILLIYWSKANAKREDLKKKAIISYFSNGKSV
tara:strand:- start:117 stop:317 length:201 start_codon:yes stop_codon:yes gene_type:complete